MTTRTATVNRPFSLKPLLAVVLAIVIVFTVAHAIERHGEVAIDIRNACEQRPSLDMTRSTDGRRMLGCEYEPGKLGVSVYERDGRFVTAYPVRKALGEFFRVRGYGQ